MNETTIKTFISLMKKTRNVQRLSINSTSIYPRNKKTHESGARLCFIYVKYLFYWI